MASALDDWDPMEDDFKDNFHAGQTPEDGENARVELDHYRLFVRHVPKTLDTTGFKKLFSDYGTVVNAFINPHPYKRYGMVTFETTSQAQNAMMQINITRPMTMIASIAKKNPDLDPEKKFVRQKQASNESQNTNQEQNSKNNQIRNRAYKNQPRQNGPTFSKRNTPQRGQNMQDTSEQPQNSIHHSFSGGNISSSTSSSTLKQIALTTGSIDYMEDLANDPDCDDLDLELEELKMREEQLNLRAKQLKIQKAKRAIMLEQAAAASRRVTPSGMVTVRSDSRGGGDAEEPRVLKRKIPRAEHLSAVYDTPYSEHALHRAIEALKLDGEDPNPTGICCGHAVTELEMTTEDKAAANDGKKDFKNDIEFKLSARQNEKTVNTDKEAVGNQYLEKTNYKNYTIISKDNKPANLDEKAASTKEDTFKFEEKSFNEDLTPVNAEENLYEDKVVHNDNEHFNEDDTDKNEKPKNYTVNSKSLQGSSNKLQVTSKNENDHMLKTPEIVKKMDKMSHCLQEMRLYIRTTTSLLSKINTGSNCFETVKENLISEGMSHLNPIENEFNEEQTQNFGNVIKTDTDSKNADHNEIQFVAELETSDNNVNLGSSNTELKTLTNNKKEIILNDDSKTKTDSETSLEFKSEGKMAKLDLRRNGYPNYSDKYKVILTTENYPYEKLKAIDIRKIKMIIKDLKNWTDKGKKMMFLDRNSLRPGVVDIFLIHGAIMFLFGNLQMKEFVLEFLPVIAEVTTLSLISVTDRLGKISDFFSNKENFEDNIVVAKFELLINNSVIKKDNGKIKDKFEETVSVTNQSISDRQNINSELNINISEIEDDLEDNYSEFEDSFLKTKQNNSAASKRKEKKHRDRMAERRLLRAVLNRLKNQNGKLGVYSENNTDRTPIKADKTSFKQAGKTPFKTGRTLLKAEKTPINAYKTSNAAHVESPINKLSYNISNTWPEDVKKSIQTTTFYNTAMRYSTPKKTLIPEVILNLYSSEDTLIKKNNVFTPKKTINNDSNLNFSDTNSTNTVSLNELNKNSKEDSDDDEGTNKNKAGCFNDDTFKFREDESNIFNKTPIVETPHVSEGFVSHVKNEKTPKISDFVKEDRESTIENACLSIELKEVFNKNAKSHEFEGILNQDEKVPLVSEYVSVVTAEVSNNNNKNHSVKVSSFDKTLAEHRNAQKEGIFRTLSGDQKETSKMVQNTVKSRHAILTHDLKSKPKSDIIMVMYDTSLNLSKIKTTEELRENLYSDVIRRDLIVKVKHESTEKQINVFFFDLIKEIFENLVYDHFQNGDFGCKNIPKFYDIYLKDGDMYLICRNKKTKNWVLKCKDFVSNKLPFEINFGSIEKSAISLIEESNFIGEERQRFTKSDIKDLMYEKTLNLSKNRTTKELRENLYCDVIENNFTVTVKCQHIKKQINTFFFEWIKEIFENLVFDTLNSNELNLENIPKFHDIFLRDKNIFFICKNEETKNWVLKSKDFVSNKLPFEIDFSIIDDIGNNSLLKDQNYSKEENAAIEGMKNKNLITKSDIKTLMYFKTLNISKIKTTDELRKNIYRDVIRHDLIVTVQCESTVKQINTFFFELIKEIFENLVFDKFQNGEFNLNNIPKFYDIYLKDGVAFFICKNEETKDCVRNIMKLISEKLPFNVACN